MGRRRLGVLVLAAVLCFSGCAGKEAVIGEALDFRKVLQEYMGCSFQTEVSACVDERIYTFTLQADYRCGGSAVFTVTAPETIAGIQAAVTGEQAEISFDGTALSFGATETSTASPLYAPLLLGRCWETAYIDAAGMDGEQYRVTYRLGYDEEERILETWFREGIPTDCELYEGERLLLRAHVEGFQFLSP